MPHRFQKGDEVRLMRPSSNPLIGSWGIELHQFTPSVKWIVSRAEDFSHREAYHMYEICTSKDVYGLPNGYNVIEEMLDPWVYYTPVRGDVRHRLMKVGCGGQEIWLPPDPKLALEVLKTYGVQLDLSKLANTSIISEQNFTLLNTGEVHA